MNILWIPHNTWGEGRYQRDQYFIKCLSKKHSIHVLLWGDYLPHTFFNLFNPNTHLKNLRFYTKKYADYFIHHLPRLPNVFYNRSIVPFPTSKFNQILRDSTIKKISRQFNIDVIITGNFGENTPLPADSLGIPVIIDYVDWINWPRDIERKVLKNAAAVITVSEVLFERSKALNINTKLISNGADIKKFHNLDSISIKKKMGLNNNKVVSVIGLTYSSLYFIDAVLLAKQKIPNLKCILVGKSDILKRYLQKNKYFADTFVYAGPIPYESITDYFAITDVGLYPVDETQYYDAASPIKLFEYTAARKPVVLPKVKEMMRVGFPNLIFASPTKESFAKAIVNAIQNPVAFPKSIDDYDWHALSSKLEFVIEQSVEKYINKNCM